MSIKRVVVACVSVEQMCWSETRDKRQERPKSQEMEMDCILWPLVSRVGFVPIRLGSVTCYLLEGMGQERPPGTWAWAAWAGACRRIRRLIYAPVESLVRPIDAPNSLHLL